MSGRCGCSKMQYEGKLYEEDFSDAIVLPARLAVDIPTEGAEGQRDVVTVSADSKDNGQTYHGTHSYKGNSYSPGPVKFTRTTREDGFDIFTGEWSDFRGRGSWIIEVEPLP